MRWVLALFGLFGLMIAACSGYNMTISGNCMWAYPMTVGLVMAGWFQFQFMEFGDERI
jgi:hypothetical protein